MFFLKVTGIDRKYGTVQELNSCRVNTFQHIWTSKYDCMCVCLFIASDLCKFERIPDYWLIEQCSDLYWWCSVDLFIQYLQTHTHTHKGWVRERGGYIVYIYGRHPTITYPQLQIIWFKLFDETSDQSIVQSSTVSMQKTWHKIVHHQGRTKCLQRIEQIAQELNISNELSS